MWFACSKQQEQKRKVSHRSERDTNTVNEGGRQGEMITVTHHSVVVFVGVVHLRHFSFVFVGMIMTMARSLHRYHTVFPLLHTGIMNECFFCGHVSVRMREKSVDGRLECSGFPFHHKWKNEKCEPQLPVFLSLHIVLVFVMDFGMDTRCTFRTPHDKECALFAALL